MDMSALLLEIEALRAELSLLKKKKPERVLCPKVTGKGVPCKRYCAEGEGACKMHSKVSTKPEKPVKPPKAPKKVCCGLSILGNTCKRKCVEGEMWCERHDPSLPVKEKKKKVDSRCVPYVANASQWVDEVTFWQRRCETMC